ncbi:MAG: ferrous iron transport protein A [Clostridiales bacterium]|jgi:ferrous iron transport protein A|nr:ferrous iron transport protein A [Clostridiales bacterium]
MPLTMATRGETYVIQRITGKDETKHFLENLGFLVGECVTVISEIGGNVIIRIKESRIALDKSMANRILV